MMHEESFKALLVRNSSCPLTLINVVHTRIWEWILPGPHRYVFCVMHDVRSRKFLFVYFIYFFFENCRFLNTLTAVYCSWQLHSKKSKYHRMIFFFLIFYWHKILKCWTEMVNFSFYWNAIKIRINYHHVRIHGV